LHNAIIALGCGLEQRLYDAIEWEMAMTKMILPTANESWGFWGVCGRSGYDQAMAWEAASDALATAFDLTDEQVRDLLDMSFGRHLADDLSFIPSGPVNVEAIESHIMARLADRHWCRWIENSVRQVRS
jgi:hypothetical protein